MTEGAEPSRWRSAYVTIRTLAVAGAGGAILLALHVPGGMMIGGIIAVAALSLSGVPVGRHPRAKQFAQLIVGTGIGASLTSGSFELLKTLAVPILGALATLMVVGVCSGLLLARTTVLDLPTSLTATAPGGMIEMVLVSDAIGGASSIVAAIHLLRILAVLGTLPLLLAILG
jgi:membrane AbrB-like protein